MIITATTRQRARSIETPRRCFPSAGEILCKCLSFAALAAIALGTGLFIYMRCNNRMQTLDDLSVAWSVVSLPLMGTVRDDCERKERYGSRSTFLCDLVLKQLRGVDPNDERLHRCRIHNDTHVRCLPNLFFIGASKAGTTYLLSLLSQYDNVQLVQRRIRKPGMRLLYRLVVFSCVQY